jgi:hypothetical protein
MDDSHTNRRTLEDLWRSRLNYAKLQLDLTRNHLKEIQRDLRVGDKGAYWRAVRAEKLAGVEYHRVLGIFTSLVVDGEIPDESAGTRIAGQRGFLDFG